MVVPKISSFAGGVCNLAYFFGIQVIMNFAILRYKLSRCRVQSRTAAFKEGGTDGKKDFSKFSGYATSDKKCQPEDFSP